MKEKEYLLTKEGLRQIEEELAYLKKEGRKEIAAEIKEAADHGDLSENAEYDEAKNRQAQLEMKIIELEYILKNAVLIERDSKKDVVKVGSTVILKDLEFNEEMEVALVGITEADPSIGKISNESPVGSAIIGSKVGDVVEVEVPVGVVQYEILEIR